MLRTSIIALFTSITVFTLSDPSLRAQPMENAGVYLEHYNNLYKPIQKDMWDYTSAIAKGKRARVVEKRRQELIASLHSTEFSVRRSKGFKGDEALRDVIADWMAASQIILKEDYEKIMDLEDIAEDSYDNMEAYMTAKELANEHLNEKSAVMSGEVERFAKENEIHLIDDDSRLAHKLERADEVFKYYNKIYLVFFKSFKQEAYLMAALDASDLNGIEQNRTTLAEYAAQGKTDLNGIKNINSDVSVKNACRELLDLYLKESKEYVDAMTSYIMKKEGFDRMQKAFEAKKKSQRTKEDVEKYNKAVNEMNQSGNEYNDVINKLNSERSSRIDNWNKSVDHFLSKYAG